VIAVAGPLVSFVLGAVLTVAGVLLGTLVPASTPIAGGIVVVGVLNLILGVLSVVPAMPLDGGRVVRAFAWSRHGDRDRAYRTTSRVGRMVGWTILGAGVALVLADQVTEGLIGIALGWLLNTGARTGERRLALEQLLRGSRVQDAMRVDVPFVGPNLTIDTFANRFEGADAVAAMPVVDEDKVVGVLGRRRLVRLGRRRFGGTRVEDVMAAPPQAPVLAPSDALWDAVEAMNEAGLDGLAVADEGQLAGLVTRESLADTIRGLAAAQAARSA
jgi:CBS domain-containing protein